jgi:hypothetical protein
MAATRSPAELARDLSHWAVTRGWCGTDPYDALNSSRRLTTPLTRTALGRRILIQAVKRCPLDLRPALGIRPGVDAATLALAVSAHARGSFLTAAEHAATLRGALGALEGLRSAGYKEACWGYHFPFQSRVFFYARGEPNTIATAFAGIALLDAHRATGEEEPLEMARAAGRFFVRHVPQTESEPGAYFGYLAGDRSPIHNSNLLVAALLARLSGHGEDGTGFAARAEAAIRYSTTRQRPDGSWPYGERANLQWVDGFHTGYVLDALRACADAGVATAEAEAAWERGIRFYHRELFLADGTPKYDRQGVLPIDSQCVAQGIQTLAIAARHDPSYAESARATFDFARRRMLSAEGLPIFQRRRLWANKLSHMRWSVAPMLLALAHLIELEAPEPSAPARAVGVA